MEKLEHTKFLIMYYLFGLFWGGKDKVEPLQPSEFVDKERLDEARRHKDFIKQIDFKSLRKELLKKIDCEICEIKETLKCK